MKFCIEDKLYSALLEIVQARKHVVQRVVFYEIDLKEQLIEDFEEDLIYKDHRATRCMDLNSQYNPTMSVLASASRKTSLLVKSKNESESPATVGKVVNMSDEKPKAMPKRCEKEECKCKLKLSDYMCRCGNYYCATHRLGETHSCSFDYRQHHKDILLKTLSSPIVAQKLAAI